MAARETDFDRLVRAIVDESIESVTQMLDTNAALAKAVATLGADRAHAKEYFLEPIGHYLYAGDTALHVAAAGHRVAIVRVLIERRADVHAQNRHGDRPLHYAITGGPSLPTWKLEAQVETIRALLAAGADPNATNKRGVTALHTAVRNRIPTAVRALIDGGADVTRKNRSGSVPADLVQHNTGRGGTGSAEAKAARDEIARILAVGKSAGASGR